MTDIHARAIVCMADLRSAARRAEGLFWIDAGVVGRVWTERLDLVVPGLVLAAHRFGWGEEERVPRSAHRVRGDGQVLRPPVEEPADRLVGSSELAGNIGAEEVRDRVGDLIVDPHVVAVCRSGELSNAADPFVVASREAAGHA